MFSTIKGIFITVYVLLAVGFLYALVKAWHFRLNFRGQAQTGKRVPTLRDALMKEMWQSIVKKFSLGTPESARLAVIEADALVDTALKNMGIQGEHLADRLSNLESEDITTMNRLWRAHRMRNDLVHTPGFALGPSEAKLALEDFEAFLQEIEVL